MTRLTSKKKHRVGEWTEPKVIKSIRDDQKHRVVRGKRRKKVCKFTKADHEYGVKRFKLINYGKFKRKWYMGYAAYFLLRIDFRCGCGKKDVGPFYYFN